jgi:hypothetical protein
LLSRLFFQKKFSGANAKQLYDEIAEAERVLEETLLAEAVQMSLQQETSSEQNVGVSATASSAEQQNLLKHSSEDATTLRVRDSLEKLRNNLSSKAFGDTTSLMLKCITNIYENPAEAKYRKIKTTNKAYKERLEPQTPALDVLRAVGFEEKDGHLCFRSDASTGQTQQLSREDLFRLDSAKKAVTAYREGCDSDPFTLFERWVVEEDNNRKR